MYVMRKVSVKANKFRIELKCAIEKQWSKNRVLGMLIALR